MNGRVKIILAILIAFLLGGAIWPAYNFGMERYNEHQYGQMVLEDVRYRVVDAVEASASDMFVMTVNNEDVNPAAHVILLPDFFPVFPPIEEGVEDTRLFDYVRGRITEVADALRETYPDLAGYYVQIYMPFAMNWEDGSSTVIGIYLYESWFFGPEGKGTATLILNEVLTYTTNPVVTVGGSLQYFYYLLASGTFMASNQIAEQALEREPGYVYPWE
jgi:hypothetical protein